MVPSKLILATNLLGRILIFRFKKMTFDNEMNLGKMSFRKKSHGKYYNHLGRCNLAYKWKTFNLRRLRFYSSKFNK
jgi:hypothetical protein